ncbi:MAG: hypothetical protein ABIK48_05825 [candidate division WOR-3 bacterium]
MIEIESDINVTIVFLCDHCRDENEVKIKDIIENIPDRNRILFFSLETLPHGDHAQSIYNRTCILRKYLEEKGKAATASPYNLLQKINELLLQMPVNGLAINSYPPELWGPINNNTPAKIEHDYLRQMEQETSNKGYREYLTFLENLDRQNCIKVNSREIKNLSILVIDDNPDNLVEPLRKIVNEFGQNVNIHITTENEWRKFIDREFLTLMYKNQGKLRVRKISSSNDSSSPKEEKEIDLFDSQTKKFQYHFIAVDLLLGNYNNGNRIIRELIKFRTAVNRNLKGHDRPAIFDVVVLSLSLNIENIERALEEGALGYVYKHRIYQLPALIAKLERSRHILAQIERSSIGKARNFSKLYQLPNYLRRKLQTEPFLDVSSSESYYKNTLATRLAHQWIKEIPKAELHCHLGGTMDVDLVFHLSLNVLFHRFRSTNINPLDYWKENLQLCGENINLNDILEKFKNELISIAQKSNGQNNNVYWKWLNKFLHENQNKWPEQLENNFTPEELFLSYHYYRYCQKLNKGSIELDRDEFICTFIVFLGVCEGKTSEDIRNFWNKWSRKLLFSTNDYPPVIIDHLQKAQKNISTHLGNGNLQEYGEHITKFYEEINASISANSPKQPGLISQLLSLGTTAQGKKRSLKNYLRPDIFCGSVQLQYYENIVIAVANFLEKATRDNVRYTELRVAPDGYCKKNLILQESIQALFDGADLFSAYLYFTQHRFIWPNFIFSGKRHKSPEQIAQEIAATVVYRQREILHLLKENQLDTPLTPSSFLYEWKPSRLVGFDLSGIETAADVERYINEFIPLFRLCIPITVHAGESATAENIWKAIYLLHANRIGHGLTLRNNKFLMDLARDLQICIELCPKSNLLTNQLIEENYPLFHFIQHGIPCTINTDDPIFSANSTLSHEFVEAARLYQNAHDNKNKLWLSKWEVLRLVKHAFKFAFISRDEKRELLRAVEEEIYQKIIWQEELEPYFPIDYNL